MLLSMLMTGLGLAATGLKTTALGLATGLKTAVGISTVGLKAAALGANIAAGAALGAATGTGILLSEGMSKGGK